MAKRISDPRTPSRYGTPCVIEIRSHRDGTWGATNLTYGSTIKYATFAELHDYMVGYQRAGDIIVFVD